MSNLVPVNAQLPAYLSDRVGTSSALGSDLLAGLGTGGGGAKFKRISIRGNRFRIREGSNEQVLPDATLRTVIVGASPNTTKSYYKGAYNPKAADVDKKPDCYSNDGVRPAKDAQDPQSQTCGNCPHNVWGSKMSEGGGKMKACADQKRLAVISADATGDDPEVYLFQVTPAALTGFREYAESLAQRGYSPEIVVTEIYFDTKESYPKAQFKFAGFIKEDQKEMIDALVDSDLVNEITGKKNETAKVVDETPKATYVPPKVEVEDAVYEDVTPVQVSKPTKGFGTATPAEPVQVVHSSALNDDIKAMLADLQEDDGE